MCYPPSPSVVELEDRVRAVGLWQCRDTSAIQIHPVLSLGTVIAVLLLVLLLSVHTSSELCSQAGMNESRVLSALAFLSLLFL